MKTELNVLEQTNILQVRGAFTKEECIQISNEILAYKELKNPNDADINHHANLGCWMGQPHFHGGFSPKIENLLITTIKKACGEYYRSCSMPLNISRDSYDIQDDQWEIWAWANVNEPGSENREHVHTGNVISAVVYFQAEGTGRLEFMPYNYTYKMTLPQWPYHGVSYYEPNDGDIILFPSFLLHRTEKNTSNKQRINMAFDAKFPSLPILRVNYA
jgi:hypothetical protein